MNAIQMPEEINQLRRRLVSTAAMGIAVKIPWPKGCPSSSPGAGTK